MLSLINSSRIKRSYNRGNLRLQLGQDIKKKSLFFLHFFAYFVYFQIHLKAPLILNGVCVRWKGWLDLDRLDGVGCLEFDDENAVVEDAKLREQVESYNRRLREFEEQSKARSRHLQSLVSSGAGHTQFPSHHHLQSDLLLEVSTQLN